ncbi:MAG: tRNA uridine-5-carboxymethylaminomethyl(34) synthesis GTPase MnmE [Candidatus Neomarinimicrobiota bacterium]
MPRKIKTTIVALSTPHGIGAISIIRLSGQKSLEIANKLTRTSKPLTPNKVQYAQIWDADRFLDEIMLTYFRAPRSYTGEDMIELSCHGSPYIIETIIDLCLLRGAVPAKPGEFTQRAFFNGKIDLLRAESIADLIAAKTQSAHRESSRQLLGEGGTQIQSLKQRIIQIISTLELELDFSDQEISFTPREQIQSDIQSVLTDIRSLVKTFSYGKLVRTGLYTPIVGPPNSGKSSLFNALLREERVIISPIPGTTRDTIEESIQKDGYLFRLVDTAGLRDTDETVESAGILRSRKTIRLADLLLFVVDATADMTDYQAVLPDKTGKTIIVINKSDIADLKTISNLQNKLAGYKTIVVSSKKRAGIHELSTLMVNHIKAHQPSGDEFVLTQKRHFIALKRMSVFLKHALTSSSQLATSEMIVIDLRLALSCLDEILGKTVNDDILNNIFQNFCVGK